MPKKKVSRKREIIKRVSYKDLPLSRTSKRNRGFDVALLDRMELWLNYVVSRYSKSYFVRLDFTFPFNSRTNLNYTDDNVLWSEFIDTFKRKYSRDSTRTDYFWVRERSTTGPQHYHVMFVLDGNIAKSSWPVLVRAQEIWAKKLRLDSGEGFVHLSPMRVKRIDRRFIEMENCNPYRYERLFEALSYMAKVYQKDTPKGLNEFGHSRIPKLREGELSDLFPELANPEHG